MAHEALSACRREGGCWPRACQMAVVCARVRVEGRLLLAWAATATMAGHGQGIHSHGHGHGKAAAGPDDANVPREFEGSAAAASVSRPASWHMRPRPQADGQLAPSPRGARLCTCVCVGRAPHAGLSWAQVMVLFLFGPRGWPARRAHPMAAAGHASRSPVGASRMGCQAAQMRLPKPSLCMAGGVPVLRWGRLNTPVKHPPHAMQTTTTLHPKSKQEEKRITRPRHCR